MTLTIPIYWLLAPTVGIAIPAIITGTVKYWKRAKKLAKKQAKEQEDLEDKLTAVRLLPEPWLTLYHELDELTVYEHARKAFVEWLKKVDKSSLPKLSAEAVDFFLYEQLIHEDNRFDTEAQECFELLLPFMKTVQSKPMTTAVQKSRSPCQGNVDPKLIADVEELTNLAMKVSKNVRDTDEMNGLHYTSKDMGKLESLAAAVELRVRLLVPEDPECPITPEA